MRKALLFLFTIAASVPTVHASCLQQQPDGTFMVSNCPLPTEPGMMLVCSQATVAGGTGATCVYVRGGIRQMKDPNDLPLEGDPPFTDILWPNTFQISEGDTPSIFVPDIDPTFEGALTPGTIFAKEGFTLSHPPNHEASFKVSSFTLANGTVRYITAGNTTSTTRNDGEFLATIPCPEVRAVCLTSYDTSWVAANGAMPASATWSVRYEVNNPGSPPTSACQLAATQQGNCCLSPATGLGWDAGDEVARTMVCTGAGCSGNFAAEVRTFCY